MLGELVVLGGQRGSELDRCAVRGRDRDDDESGLGLADIGGDRHPRAVPVDAADRRVEHNARAQFGGRGLGDLLRTARKTVLLGTVFDVEQPVQAAGGVRVTGRVQHRHVVGFAPPGHPGHDRQQVARGGGGAHRAQPAAERHIIELARPARVPRGRQRDAAGNPVELPTQPADVEQAGQRELGDGAAVGMRPAAPVDHVLAVVVGRDGRDAEFGRQRQDRVLGRADEGAPQIGGQPRHAAGERPTADAVAALEDHHVMALAGQLARRGKPRKACADHDNVDNPRRIWHAHQSTPIPEVA